MSVTPEHEWQREERERRQARQDAELNRQRHTYPDGRIVWAPKIRVGEKAAGPTCGRCGTPWVDVGTGPSEYDTRVRLCDYQPRCQCWKDGRWE